MSGYHAVLGGEHDNLLGVAFNQRPIESKLGRDLVKDDRLQLFVITNQYHVTGT